MNPARLPWRFRLNKLAVQITLLIFVSIVAFQTIVIGMFHVFGRRHIVDQGDFIASIILALDVAPLSERANVISALSHAVPYASIEIQESRPAAATSSTGGGDLAFENEIRHIDSLLWGGADVFEVESSAPGDYGVLAVELHKGGYATVSIAEHQKSPGSIWRWLWQHADDEPFILTQGARTALSFIIFTAIFVFWALNAIMAPLRRLAKYAEQIPNDVDTKAQLPERGPQEVRELTRSLNRMQARISKMIAARAHVLAAVSHDLRTIITRLKLKTEFVSDQNLQQRMMRDVDLMDAMLFKNLQYLRAEGDDKSDCSLVDLDSVLQTVADEFCDLGHHVTYHGGGRQMVFGSLCDVQRIFTNLVENATHHAKTVDIYIADGPGGLIEVDVVDDGPGMSADGKNTAFEPFVRGQPGRTLDEHSGFGLGLSIVRSLVENHGGSVSLLDREPSGLIARVCLPRAVEGDDKLFPTDSRAAPTLF
ncbi:ATP-binding protein [Methylocystis hirsuta]|uniref:histidine kinase n=1 Tax=Methylocystis hirsuta TaxID=369798 RepID=A0A3M9XMV8_9HYPH|nr:ATP-binding protein [Methylocystis hirsuta]RNJ49116.1 HAMP domain-containing protein [Methylocystis hirsuta]